MRGKRIRAFILFAIVFASLFVTFGTHNSLRRIEREFLPAIEDFFITEEISFNEISTCLSAYENILVYFEGGTILSRIDGKESVAEIAGVKEQINKVMYSKDIYVRSIEGLSEGIRFEVSVTEKVPAVISIVHLYPSSLEQNKPLNFRISNEHITWINDSWYISFGTRDHT